MAVVQEGGILGQNARIELDRAQSAARKLIACRFAKHPDCAHFCDSVQRPVQHQPFRIGRIEGDPAQRAQRLLNLNPQICVIADQPRSAPLDHITPDQRGQHRETAQQPWPGRTAALRQSGQLAQQLAQPERAQHHRCDIGNVRAGLQRSAELEFDCELAPAAQDWVGQIAQFFVVKFADRTGDPVQMVDKPTPDVRIICKPAVWLVLGRAQQQADQLERAIGEDNLAWFDPRQGAVRRGDNQRCSATRSSKFDLA